MLGPISMRRSEGTVFGLLVALVFVTVISKTSANMRVIGWKFHSDSSVYYTFGAQGSRNRSILTAKFAGHYCWEPDRTLSCYLTLYFSHGEDGTHYQILGGGTDIYDIQSKRFCETKTWGDTSKGTKQGLMHGVRWADCMNDWGYAYTFLYVEKSSDPPFLKALSQQRFKRDNSQKMRARIVAGSTRGAQKQMVGDYRCWTRFWDDDCHMEENFYMSESILTDYRPLYDQRKMKKSSNVAIKTRVIVNDGCGKEYVEGMTGSITSSEELTMVTKARWQNTFSFSIGATVETSVVSVSISLTTNFEWSVTKEMETEQTNKKVWSYIWPRHCTPGYKCTYNITKMTQGIEIPVVFTFKRGDETFEKRNTLMTTEETWHEEKRSEKLPSRGCQTKRLLEQLTNTIYCLIIFKFFEWHFRSV